MSQTPLTASENRERLEHEADAARDRLLSDLDRLSERGRRAGLWARQVTRAVRENPLALIVVGAAAVGAVGMLLLRKRQRQMVAARRATLLGLGQRIVTRLLPRVP